MLRMTINLGADVERGFSLDSDHATQLGGTVLCYIPASDHGDHGVRYYQPWAIISGPCQWTTASHMAIEYQESQSSALETSDFTSRPMCSTVVYKGRMLLSDLPFASHQTSW